MKPKLKTRFYNQLRVEDRNVFKTSDSTRIQKEYDWYVESNKYIPNNIPTVRLKELQEGQLYLIMNLIEGPNLYEFSKGKDIDDIKEIIYSYFNLITKVLHQGQLSSKNSDIRQMYLEKPSKAIDYFYSRYLKKKSTMLINNRVCKEPLKLLSETYSRLEQNLLDTKYTFIHGDPTLSNTIIDKGNRLFCIDPRGGFGETKNYGDPRYDITKLYYSLVGGFDALNNHKFRVSKDDSSFNYQIFNPHKNDGELLFWNFFDKDRKIIKFIHSTIWLSLTPHLEESVAQTQTAFLNGTYLLNTIYD